MLTSTVSKLGLSIAPIPEEINELVALVILLIREDLICSESSAFTLKDSPKVMVSIELKSVLEIFDFDIFIVEIISSKDLII